MKRNINERPSLVLFGSCLLMERLERRGKKCRKGCFWLAPPSLEVALVQTKRRRHVSAHFAAPRGWQHGHSAQWSSGACNSCHASGKTFQWDKSSSSPQPGLTCQFSPHAFQTGPSAKDAFKQDVWGLIMCDWLPKSRQHPSVSPGLSLLSVKVGKLFIYRAW